MIGKLVNPATEYSHFGAHHCHQTLFQASYSLVIVLDGIPSLPAKNLFIGVHWHIKTDTYDQVGNNKWTVGHRCHTELDISWRFVLNSWQ